MPFVNDGFAKQDPASGGGGGSTNASDLTSGTLADARLSSGILNATYQHNQYVLTTGTTTAYVATPTVAIVLADGVEVLCGIHTTSGAAPTLNVSGTGARAIYKEGAAGLTAVGTGQLLSGPNIYKFTYNAGFSGWVVSSPLFLQASDMPSGIDATDIADGSVTNTEFQYISTLTSNAQDQLNGKASTSHSHAASDTTSGSFNTARIADGTATAGYVPISDGDGTSTWGAPSASDSTKLPLAGGTMTGVLNLGALAAITFSATGATTGAFDVYRHSSGYVSWRPIVQFEDQVGLNGGYGLFFTNTQVSAGASIANIFRDSTGDLNYNVDTGDVHDFTVNGTSQAKIGATGIQLPTDQTAGYSLPGISNHNGHLGLNVPTSYEFHFLTADNTYVAALSAARGLVVYGTTTVFDSDSLGIKSTGIICSSPVARCASLCSAGGGTTLPEVVVHGLSETAYAGAIEVKAGAVARTNNGTWTNIFSLAKGTHYGEIRVFSNKGGGAGLFSVSNTSLALVGDYDTGLAYVESGSEAAGYVALRISGGNIQINVGTSVASDCSFAIVFQGTVV